MRRWLIGMAALLYPVLWGDAADAMLVLAIFILYYPGTFGFKGDK